MREGGVERAVRAIGGVGALARGLGISQPSVSNWRQVPAERVLAVEALTGVSRSLLRPDLYPNDSPAASFKQMTDEVDLLRSHEYGLLALLFGRAPTQDVLEALQGLKGDATALGLAHIELAEAASRTTPEAASREFFDLFVGLGRGELLPYGSYYLTGFLHERPLARVREDMARLGLERAETLREPEDHVAILCEIMAGLAGGRFEAEPDFERRFFERHLKPWAARFFVDVETARAAGFYRAAGRLGALFMEVEAQAFTMDD